MCGSTACTVRRGGAGGNAGPYPPQAPPTFAFLHPGGSGPRSRLRLPASGPVGQLVEAVGQIGGEEGLVQFGGHGAHDAAHADAVGAEGVAGQELVEGEILDIVGVLGADGVGRRTPASWTGVRPCFPHVVYRNKS